MKVNKINLNNVSASNSKKNNSSVNKQGNSYKQINELSNVCYKPISFGRKAEEHKSWGAVVDPQTKDVTFKLLTFPDVKKVEVNIQKNGSEEVNSYELKNIGEGIFATEKPFTSDIVAHGDKYSYTIHKADGSIDTVKDPYSFKQEELLGKSTVYDHSLYEWKDADWYKSNPQRISKKADNYNFLTPLSNARIYEFNTATFTKDGDFEGAKKALNALPKMGFNAIEIMPVENTYSFNWGYDGVDKLAVSEHLGGPDGLKSLIDHAHSLGLNVIMDMVPNHLGPDGAALHVTGPYTDGPNDFGMQFNFEKENSKYVRDYIVNCALNWIENYHCDGLRLDMTKYMKSDSTMKQIAAEVNHHCPDAFLIAEDARDKVSVDENGNYWGNDKELHDMRIMNPLKQDEACVNYPEDVHCSAIEKIEKSSPDMLGNLGFDSEWDFKYYHELKDALYGAVNLDEIEEVCTKSENRVKYVMSHDEIGNYDGTRLLSKLMVPSLNLVQNVFLTDEDFKRADNLAKHKHQHIDQAKQTVSAQKAQLVAEKLTVMLQTGNLDRYDSKKLNAPKYQDHINEAFYREVLEPLGVKREAGITYDKLKAVYEMSYAKNKMALARTYSIPGPKMIFQGDERADLTPFRFFRQFDSIRHEDYLYYEKGYQPAEAALNESTLGNIPYSKEAKAKMNQYHNLTRDLNLLMNENPALSTGKIDTKYTVKHKPSHLIATLAKDEGTNNQIYSITNFLRANYPSSVANEYYITFPPGKWVEVLNTDDEKYGGTGKYTNKNRMIESNGFDGHSIKVSAFSTLMFRKVDD